jgi:hypothetical protein
LQCGQQIRLTKMLVITQPYGPATRGVSESMSSLGAIELPG